MTLLATILFFGILGAIIGSFLNVVVLRLHTGKSLSGRSHCMSCGGKLFATDLVPVLSYLALRGRCRQCGSRFSGRYAFVEALTGGLFVLMALTEPDPILLVAKLAIVTLLVAIFFYDLTHLIIPNELAALLIIPAGILQVWNSVIGEWEVSNLLWPSVAALLVFLFFYGLWRVSRGRWLGLGDAKLAAPLALAAGAASAFSFVVLAFWIGAFVSVILLALGRALAGLRGTTHLSFLGAPLTMKSEVPFAPFLIVSYLLVTVFHVDVLAFTLSLFPVLQ